MDTNNTAPKGPYSQVKFVEFTIWRKTAPHFEVYYILEDGITEVKLAHIFSEYNPASKKWSHVTKDLQGNELTEPTEADYPQKIFVKKNALRMLEEIQKNQPETELPERKGDAPQMER